MGFTKKQLPIDTGTGIFRLGRICLWHEITLVETVKLHDANPLDLMMNLAVGTDSAKIKTMLFASNTS